MFSMIKRPHLKIQTGGLIVLGTLASIFLISLLYIWFVLHQVSERIDQLKSNQPTVFYGVFPALKRGDVFSVTQLETFLTDVGFRKSRAVDG
jgi:type II secretory pathway component PulL